MLLLYRYCILGSMTKFSVVIITVGNLQMAALVNSQKADHISRCELHTLSLTSSLVDHFNSRPQYDWIDNLYRPGFIQDFMASNIIGNQLGFAGWYPLTYMGKEKKTPQVYELQVKNGWMGRSSLSQSRYSALEDKWIYMIGDSTTRQIFAKFSAPFHGNSFERNAKEWTRENCAPQWPDHRKHHWPGDHPEEGWSGKCGNNEVTCHVSGFGSSGILTFDWKHFAWEDYDGWLWGNNGPLGFNSSKTIKLLNTASAANFTSTGRIRQEQRSDGTSVKIRHPDIITIQTGLHQCVHAKADPKASMNHLMIKKNVEDLKKLMRAVRISVDRHNSIAGPNITVILSTSGRVGHRAEGPPMLEHDECVYNFNRAAARAARTEGFAVFERGEIERRLLYASQNKEIAGGENERLRFKMHLDAPAPEIISTGLLELMSCMRNESFFN